MITLRGTHVSYLRDNYVEYLKSNTFPRKNSIYPNGNTYLDKLLTDLINNPNENVFVIKGNDDICKLCNNMYNCNDQTNDTRDRLFLKIYGLTENKMYTSKEILEILAETVPPQNYQQNSPLENFLETITPIAVMGTILGGFALGAGLIEKLFGNNNDANTSNNNNNNNTSNNANQKNNNYNKNF